MTEGEATVGTGEAARSLKVSLPYLHRLIYRDQLEARLVDGRWRIPAANVERLRDERARETLGANVRMSATAA